MSLFNIGRGIVNYKGLKIDWYLAFDGVDDYVQARNTSDLDFALPMKLNFRKKATGTNRYMTKSRAASVTDRWGIYDYDTSIGMRSGSGINFDDYTKPINLSVGQRYEYLIYQDSSEIVQAIDGVEIGRDANMSVPDDSTPYNFFLAAYGTVSDQASLFAEVDIYSFQVGSETFLMNEGIGSTIITGSEGTILDINGATWQQV